MTPPRLTTAFLLSMLFAFAVSAAPNWRVLGPGGGGAQFFPTVSPHDPGTALVGCDMTGTYLTRDGGKTWRMINLRGTPRWFAFHPADPKIMYAYTIGLWRSTDSGGTWNLIYPDPAKVTRSWMPDDHAGERLVVAGEQPERIAALAIDPAPPHAVVAVLGDTLKKSLDGGRMWTLLAGGAPAQVKQIHFAGGRIYLVSNAGVARLEQDTLHFTAAPARFADVSAGLNQSTLVIYGAGPSGIFVSTDAGETWRNAPAWKVRAVATSLNHPNVAYASYSNLLESGKSYFGVAKTVDSGSTWTPVWKETGNSKSPDVDDGWVSQRFGPGWGEAPLAIGVSPTNPDIAYSTDFGRTLRTTDGGKHWTAAYTRKSGADSWTSTGLDVTTNYGVHFDPFDRNHLFISYTDIGLFESTDGGASWRSATTNGIPREWVNTTYWMVFDPEVQGRMWAVMSGTHDLPRPKMWRRTAISRYRGGVAQSDDGGKSWRTATGLPQTAATHILLDSGGGPSARTLYVAGFGQGIFRSRDSGKTWELKNTGLPAPEPFVWQLARDRQGALYAVVARRSEDGSIGTPQDGALFRSRDGAESWQKVELPAGVNGPNGLSVDPQDSNRLYLAAWRSNNDDANGGGGVYLSTDAGASWRQVLSEDQHIYDVTIDPRDRRILYACGFESSAWRSTDAGEHWRRIPGYDFKWGHRVIPDPHDPTKIFITTFGGSVWHGSSGGK